MTEDKPKISLEVNITNSKWKNTGFDIKRLCNKLSRLVLDETKLKTNTTISLLLCSDAEIKKINQQFRKINQPTNTLSFPSEDVNYLGDIAIAFETTSKEAKMQTKLFKNHFSHLYIHSLLHLLGHDHVTTKDAKIMENKEIKILEKLKIKNPYII